MYQIILFDVLQSAGHKIRIIQNRYIQIILFKAEIKESSFSAFNNFLWASGRMLRELIWLLNLNA